MTALSGFMIEALSYPGDSQKVELLGRNRLVDELLRDGLEVATPLRDRGIDLIAYIDLSSSVDRYVARPIQMKAAWEGSFTIDRKYDRLRDLIIAYVWHLGDRARATTYAMTHQQAVAIGEAMGWTQTKTWIQAGTYATTKPSARLAALLEPYRMQSGSWWALITSAPPQG